MATEPTPRPLVYTGETIDLTPSWQGQLNLILLVLENDPSDADRAFVLAELRRMARLADLYVRADRAGVFADDGE